MDVQPLYAAAARIDDLADRLRSRARLVGLQSASLRWRSPAARAYLTRVAEATAAVDASAAQVNGLADRVRAFAAALAASP